MWIQDIYIILGSPCSLFTDDPTKDVESWGYLVWDKCFINFYEPICKAADSLFICESCAS